MTADPTAQSPRTRPFPGPEADADAVTSVTDGGMVAVVQQVRRRWASVEAFTPATLDKCGEVIARFARRLQSQGVHDPAGITATHCQGFVDASTARGRPRS